MVAGKACSTFPFSLIKAWTPCSADFIDLLVLQTPSQLPPLLLSVLWPGYSWHRIDSEVTTPFNSSGSTSTPDPDFLPYKETQELLGPV